MVKIRILCFFAFLILVSCLVRSQDSVPPSEVFHANKEIKINDLPVLRARSTGLTPLGATLATIFHDSNVCCGKDSALEDTVLAADSLSLKDLSTKLQGKHFLSDGRPIMMTTEYVPVDAINSGQVITSLTNRQAQLFEWNSHLYVLYGAVYDEAYYDDGHREYVIHKLLLLDTRFSDARREISFNRESDDLRKVQGLIILKTSSQ